VTVAGTGGAGEVHYLDKVDIGPGSTAPWTIGGFAANGAYTIEASEDGGVTWRTVRGGPFTVDSAADQAISVYDYERTPGVTASYRVRVSNILSGVTVTSANSSLATDVPHCCLYRGRPNRCPGGNDSAGLDAHPGSQGPSVVCRVGRGPLGVGLPGRPADVRHSTILGRSRCTQLARSSFLP